MDPKTLTVKELKTQLRDRKLPVTGTKPVLQARLAAAITPTVPSSPVQKPVAPARPSVFELINDLIEIVALYTTPFISLDLLTLDEDVAKVGYRAGLWKRKAIFERKGRVLDTVPNWYVYYRIINRRLEGGEAIIVTGKTANRAGDLTVDSGVLEAQDRDVGILTLTSRYMRSTYYRPGPQVLEVRPKRRPELVDDLSGLTRDGRTVVAWGEGQGKLLPDGDVGVDASLYGPALLRDGRVLLPTAGSEEEMPPGPGIADVVSILHPWSSHLYVVIDQAGVGWTAEGERIRVPEPGPLVMPVWSTHRERGDTLLCVFPNGACNTIPRDVWDSAIYRYGSTSEPSVEITNRHQFPEVPQVIRAVWGTKVSEILLLSPDGRVHLYDIALKKPYKGVVDLPECADLLQAEKRFVYITVK